MWRLQLPVPVPLKSEDCSSMMFMIYSRGNDFVRLLRAIWDLIAAGPTLSTSSCGIVVSLGCYKRRYLDGLGDSDRRIYTHFELAHRSSIQAIDVVG
jgi:hypothetical protein